ncbi:MAG TPA: signal peptidase I [Methylomirabilota bacterium]|nr:signal peptidase I [Methylomirabilota bacterium]
MLFLKWFTSRTVRHAWQAANHVEKILRHQSDLLSPDATEAVQTDIENVRIACRAGDKNAIHHSLATLEKTANKWLKSYPHSALRENIEVALVAIAVAMGIRTFFLQPFKIPTGSMQPTLYGVTQEDLRGLDDVRMPGRLAGFAEYWFNGVQYFHLTAKSSGSLTWDEPKKLVLFNWKQTYRINGVTQGSVWFPPDELFARSGISPGAQVQAGQDILKLRVISGDHLFVDRVTYNFRRPDRGDIIVFETHGIEELKRQSPQLADTYYIKRLCGLGGEQLQLRQDYYIMGVPRMGTVPVGHLVVNGRELSAATPLLENLYSFPDAPRGANSLPYRENHYYGHGLLEAFGVIDAAQVATNRYFTKPYDVPPDHYFVMGDNTFNSSDSRYWGDFHKSKVTGKSFFVYWPIGGTMFKGEKRDSRFGWAHR